MMTIPAIENGSVVSNGLVTWYDIGNPESYLPGQSTIYDMSGNNKTGSISGTWNYSTAYGGCINLTNTNDSTIAIPGSLLNAAFTTQVVVMSSTDANASQNWTNDQGAFPGFRGTNGFLGAVQSSGGNNWIAPIVWNGSSAATYANFPASTGWTGWTYWPNVYTYAESGTTVHAGYLNNIFKSTQTATLSRGDMSAQTNYINFDSFSGNRHGTGRFCAYLQYNRQLTDDEIYQNVQFYFNKLGTK